MQTHHSAGAKTAEAAHVSIFQDRLRKPIDLFRKVQLFSTLALLASGTGLLSACGGNGFMGGDGPSLGQIRNAAGEKQRAALIIDINAELSKRLGNGVQQADFASTFGEGWPYRSFISPGDTLQITLFEAPPAVLFASGSSVTTPVMSGQRGVTLPDIEVDASGRITVPFVGILDVADKTPQAVGAQIVARLQGKAHQPQAVVTVRNEASAVTIVGQVRSSTRMPLTSRGERVLDAIAAAGGASEPIDKVSLRITRAGRSAQMPLDQVIASPGENIFLRPSDVLTVSYQSQSFTVLGATGRNDEIKFEAKGITLAQALGRVGGLRDDRANPGGVFVFRLEDAATLALVQPGINIGVMTDADGKVPVIYRVNLRNPITFFAAQHFAIRDRDIVYVTNAPVSDLQKFVNIIGAAVYPVVTVKAAGF